MENIGNNENAWESVRKKCRQNGILQKLPAYKRQEMKKKKYIKFSREMEVQI